VTKWMWKKVQMCFPLVCRCMKFPPRRGLKNGCSVWLHSSFSDNGNASILLQCSRDKSVVLYHVYEALLSNGDSSKECLLQEVHDLDKVHLVDF
jgi:hypothetical protein